MMWEQTKNEKFQGISIGWKEEMINHHDLSKKWEHFLVHLVYQLLNNSMFNNIQIASILQGVTINRCGPKRALTAWNFVM